MLGVWNIGKGSCVRMKGLQDVGHQVTRRLRWESEERM